MRKGCFTGAVLLSLSLSGCAGAANLPQAEMDQPQAADAEEGQVLANALFSITLPGELAEWVDAETTENSISLYDRESADAGFGGFAFAVAAFKEPSEYAGGMDVKVGELTAGDGTLYDIALTRPSDVQWDYTKSAEMPEHYASLYHGAEEIVRTLTGADGAGTFVWGAGTKGGELYGEVLEKLVTAVSEAWGADRLEDEGFSSMYYMMGQGGGNALDRVGFAYYDVNYDGVEELLIGEIAEGDWKGTVYDVCTMVDRAPEHVVSGWDRNRYYALEGGMLVREWSDSAMESGWDICDIEPNTTNLLDQVQLKIDSRENEEQPWSVSYDDGETWESMTEEEFEERRSNFSDYVRFDFTPLSAFAAASAEERAFSFSPRLVTVDVG